MSRGMELKRVVCLARHGARSALYNLPELGPANWNQTGLYQIPGDVSKVTVELAGVNGGPCVAEHEPDGNLPCGGPAGWLSTLGYLGNAGIGEFLGKTYGKRGADDIYVRSTNVKRTVESARAVVGGVTDRPCTMKIEVEGKPEEEFLTYKNSCGGSLQNYRWMWFASPLYEQIRPMWSEAVQQMGFQPRRDGRPQHHLIPLSLYDDLTARFTHGIPVENADVFRKFYPLIEHLSLVSCLGTNGTSVEEKAHTLPIKAGRILEHVLNELDAPLSILSVHDTTLIPVMEALLFRMAPHKKSEIFCFPPFSAHIDFEFHQDADSNKFIRIRYCEKPISFNGKEYIPIQAFLDTTDWLRMSHEEWLKWKEEPIPDHKSRYSEDDIADFHNDPQKYLKF